MSEGTFNRDGCWFTCAPDRRRSRACRVFAFAAPQQGYPAAGNPSTPRISDTPVCLEGSSAFRRDMLVRTSDNALTRAGAGSRTRPINDEIVHAVC